MALDPRLVAQIAAQILKETEDLSPRGDFMVSMRLEGEIRSKNAGELPGHYRYHLTRIGEAIEMSSILIESAELHVAARERWKQKNPNLNASMMKRGNK